MSNDFIFIWSFGTNIASFQLQTFSARVFIIILLLDKTTSNFAWYFLNIMGLWDSL